MIKCLSHYKSILTKNYKKLKLHDLKCTNYLLNLIKSFFKICLKQYFKSIKIFLVTNIMDNLFHNFGAAAKKAHSPSLNRAIAVLRWPNGPD